MTATLAPGRARTSRGPTHYRWTIDEYRELGRRGLLRDGRTLLIDGEILDMPLPDPPHNLSLGLIEDWLRTVFASGHHVRNQMALDVGTDSDPGPDLAVVAGARRDYADRQATTAVLVVEIADSSLQLDTTRKAELYATAGVPDYWVVDLEHRRILVFRDPAPLPSGLAATAYRTRLMFNATDTLAPLAAPTATVRVGDLLP